MLARPFFASNKFIWEPEGMRPNKADTTHPCKHGLDAIHLAKQVIMLADVRCP